MFTDESRIIKKLVQNIPPIGRNNYLFSRGGQEINCAWRLSIQLNRLGGIWLN